MREHKIGEIFEYNGEWYQCLIGNRCRECDFSSNNITCDIHGTLICTCKGRSDETSVVFKKLEKVGEPITVNGKKVQFLKTTIANCDNCAFYKDINCDFTCYPRKCYGGEEGTYVEIKQTKEDMEEKKLNLKPFDLQKAKEGKPVCTRDGRKARIICFDKKDIRPIVALIKADNGDESAYYYYANGTNLSNNYQSVHDLMMLPEKKEGWVNVYNADTTFYYVEGMVYNTKDEAIQKAKEEITTEQREKSEYLDTVKINWEE